MKKKRRVITTFRGTPHCLAICFNCNWNEAADCDDKKERQRVRNAMHKHIRETGHNGSIETGIVSHYGLE